MVIFSSLVYFVVRPLGHHASWISSIWFQTMSYISFSNSHMIIITLQVFGRIICGVYFWPGSHRRKVSFRAQWVIYPGMIFFGGSCFLRPFQICIDIEGEEKMTNLKVKENKLIIRGILNGETLCSIALLCPEDNVFQKSSPYSSSYIF